MRGYNLDTNTIIPNITFFATLDDLNNDYTYVRQNPAGGRKRRSKRVKRRKSRKSRRSRRY